MRYSLILLGITSTVIPALADRGSATNVVPTICNNVPTESPSPTSAPSCEHAADPSGAEDLCPNPSEGWCDCGSDGDYSVLSGSDICAYTSLDPASAITRTTCSTTTEVLTETVVPVPATTSAAAKRSEPTFVPARRGVSRRLNKRDGTVSYADSCNNAPPSGSSYKPSNGFNTMADALKAAYTDARTLASLGQNVAADNKGFTHYFGGAKADVQLQHFQRMLKGVASDDINYNIQFECENTPDCSTDPTQGSSFVTDSSPGNSGDQKIVQVCPSFWTAASTRFLLFDSNHAENGSPPWRNNDASGWCNKKTVNGQADVSSQQNQFFATAGHAVLHELTHLDALATYAGLTADDDFRHGTFDPQGTCELQGARQYLIDYVAGTTDSSPDYNAESYAAAATEIWFMNLCGFSEIQPITS